MTGFELFIKEFEGLEGKYLVHKNGQKVSRLVRHLDGVLNITKYETSEGEIVEVMTSFLRDTLEEAMALAEKEKAIWEKGNAIPNSKYSDDHELGAPQMGGAYAEDGGIYGWDLD